jgi:CRISPR type III-B/RAMP module RAMP protein Cmr6
MVKMYYTKILENQCLPDEYSPSLAYHKWQAYDLVENKKTKKFEYSQEYKGSRKEFLINIANNIQSVNMKYYKKWYKEYFTALSGLEVNEMVPADTVWRMIVGAGSNPTLESGIYLHHLYGFPYIPGSSIKGVLHHLAELEIMEEPDSLPTVPEDGKLPDNPSIELLNALEISKLVWHIFGSLFLEQNEKDGNKSGSDCPLPILNDWKDIIINTYKEINSEEKNPWYKAYKDLDLITAKAGTGALLTCFDAVPSPEMFSTPNNILQLDILNPHYSDYYGEKKDKDKPCTIYPTDDQNPIPFYYLAVKPKTRFHFVFKTNKKGNMLYPEINNIINKWIDKAFEDEGIGAKTAAGYGYFSGKNNPPNGLTPAINPNDIYLQQAIDLLPEGITDIRKVFHILINRSTWAPQQRKHIVKRLNTYYPQFIQMWKQQATEKNEKAKQLVEWIQRNQ